MAIKFEKKVIIGSVTSFVVAAVGVIAVFFPSLFNLEKKGIKEFNYEIHDAKTAENFSKEMEKIVYAKEDKSLYHYKIKICVTGDHYSYQTAKDKEDDRTTYLEIDNENGSLSFMSRTNDEDKMSDGGDVYYFNIPIDWDKNIDCGNTSGADIIDGYAYYSGSGFNQGIAEFTFTPVAEKDIMLKDY